MPRAQIPCPKCGKSFRLVPKMRGRKVRCGQCNQVFRITAAAFDRATEASISVPVGIPVESPQSDSPEPSPYQALAQRVMNEPPQVETAPVGGVNPYLQRYNQLPGSGTVELNQAQAEFTRIFRGIVTLLFGLTVLFLVVLSRPMHGGNLFVPLATLAGIAAVLAGIGFAGSGFGKRIGAMMLVAFGSLVMVAILLGGVYLRHWHGRPFSDRFASHSPQEASRDDRDAARSEDPMPDRTAESRSAGDSTGRIKESNSASRPTVESLFQSDLFPTSPSHERSSPSDKAEAPSTQSSATREPRSSETGTDRILPPKVNFRQSTTSRSANTEPQGDFNYEGAIEFPTTDKQRETELTAQIRALRRQGKRFLPLPPDVLSEPIEPRTAQRRKYCFDPQARPMVGFLPVQSAFFSDHMRGILPLYETTDDPDAHMADEGYAIGGFDIVTFAGALQAIRPIYFRVDGRRLDPEDSRLGTWLISKNFLDSPFRKPPFVRRASIRSPGPLVLGVWTLRGIAIQDLGIILDSSHFQADAP